MRLRHKISGRGNRPLLCVHGWGCRKEQFDDVAGRVGGHYRVYQLDLPGHGETPLGDFVPTFANFANVVIAFAHEHGLNDAVLLGHSMGGALALMAAAEMQPRAVVNLDGSFPAAARVLAAQETILGWLSLPDACIRLAKALRETYFLPAERGPQCDEIIREMCAMPESVLRFLPEQIGSLRPEKYLPRIAAPVWYVGAASPRFAPEEARCWVNDFHFVQFPDTGHFLHIFAPEQVAGRLKELAPPV